MEMNIITELMDTMGLYLVIIGIVLWFNKGRAELNNKIDLILKAIEENNRDHKDMIKKIEKLEGQHHQHDIDYTRILEILKQLKEKK